MNNEHYFSHDIEEPDEIGEVTLWFGDWKLDLLTSPRVFSYRSVDKGTMLLIDNMKVSKGEWVLDIGCGYGPISVCAAVQGANVVGIDVNPRAAWLASRNLGSHSPGTWLVVVGNLYDPLDTRFNHILCNPPIRAGRETVAGIIERAPKYLRKDGSLLIVAKTNLGAKPLSSLMESKFGNVREVDKKSGYRVFLSRCRGGRVD